MPEKASKDLIFFSPFVAALFLVWGGWLWAWNALRGIQSPLILHFSEYTGINQIGGMNDVHGIAATGSMIVMANFMLARALRNGHRRWAGLLGGTTLFAAALLFTALAAIISVNQ